MFTSNGGLDLQFGDNAATDRLTLSGGDVTIDVNSGTAGAESLDVQAALNGGQDLILNVDGATTFQGTVGATTAVGDGNDAAITVNSAGTTEFQSTVETASGITQNDAAGEITFRDNVDIAAGDTATTFNADVTIDGGATDPDALNFSSASDVTFGSDEFDTLTIIPDVNFSIAGTAVFNATVNNVAGMGDFVFVVGSFTVDQAFDTNGANFDLTTTSGDVDFNANGQINTQGVAQDGNVSIRSNVGSINMVDGATVNSGMGTILFSAPMGTVQLTGLSTTNTSDTAVRIEAGDMVTDAGDTNVDIDANSGRVVIQSVNGVGATAGLGADSAIETQVDSVDITNTTTGSVELNEVDDLAIFNITTPDFVDLDVTNGAITDRNAGPTPDIQANGVALRAMNGIGDGDPIDTEVQVFAASNTSSGNIEIFNTGAGIIGTVNGLDGITNADPTLGGGAIIITNASPLTVDAPVLNSTSGDIMLTSRNDGDLTVNRQVRATGGDGSIMLDAGDGTLRINDDPNAADELQVEGAGMIIGEPSAATEVAGGVFFRSGTGRVSSTVPNLVIDPLSQEDIPDVTNTGVAEVSFEYGRAGEENFTTVVEFGVLAPGNEAVFETSVVGRSDTGDGTSPEVFTPAERGFLVADAMPQNPGRATFDNTGPDGNGSFLEGNPNPDNASAAVLMRITVINDPNISIGSSEVVFVVSAAIPGEGIGAVIVDSGGVVEELTFPDEGDPALAAGNITPVSLSSQAEEIVQRVVEAALESGRQIIIHPLTPTGERVTSVDENGNDALVEIELDESVLNDLTRLFAELPDGRYRIYLREAGEERLRLLFDINVRSGKITSIERVVEESDGGAANEDGKQDDGEEHPQERGQGNGEQESTPDGESQSSSNSQSVPRQQQSASAESDSQSELDRRWAEWMPSERNNGAAAVRDTTRRGVPLSAVHSDVESIPTKEDLAGGLVLPADSTYTLLAGGAMLIAGRWKSRDAARRDVVEVDAVMEALDESKLSRAARLCRKLREEEL
jgi:hypothetical protein